MKKSLQHRTASDPVHYIDTINVSKNPTSPPVKGRTIISDVKFVIKKILKY